MARKRFPITQFRSEIDALIAEIEACIHSAPSRQDRETRFQHEAFRERRRQAEALSSQLDGPDRSKWPMRSGEAHRIEESLRLSLAYFRDHRHA